MKIYENGSDFRLGAQQYDFCGHRHRTPHAAAECDHWTRYGIPNPVVVEFDSRDPEGHRIGRIVTDPAR